jgi:hypothetical protein
MPNLPASSTQVTELQYLLDFLSELDAATIAALDDLSDPLATSGSGVTLVTCQFRLWKVFFSARISAYHCEAIQTAVKNGGDVFATVSHLIACENGALRSAFTSLSTGLTAPCPSVAPTSASSTEVSAAPSGTVPTSGSAPPLAPSGCCVCESGTIAGLTNAQCIKLGGYDWTPDPTCSQTIAARRARG